MTPKKDEEVLASIGYKQEFKRAFTPFEVFGIAFSITGLVPGIASSIVFVLPNGGATSLVWGWAVCASFLFFIALALGELASAAPTSGGLYFWTYKYASPKWRNVLSWIVGNSNTMGNVAALSAVAWGCAVQLMAAVSIGSNLTFTPTTGQLYAVYIGLLILAGLIASSATRLLARIQGIYVALNVLLWAGILIALPAATPSEFKNTASYAFGGFSNLYGWVPGFAFILSFLLPLWTIGGFDAPIHISEEASNADTAVPWAIVSAVGTAGILGFAINIAIAFNMGTDINAIMSSPVGQPMATILFNSFGTKGTLAVWSVIVVTQFMVATNVITSCSRQTFAFSRDGGLPFSSILYRINRHTQTPVNCVWAAILVATLFGLLAFAGPNAINALFSLAITGQNVAFSIPVASRFLGGTEWRAGPFSLGKLSPFVSLIAVLFMMFTICIVMFPTTPGPTAGDMNYTVAVSGGWILLCLIYYYFPKYGGMYWFKGPIASLDVHSPAVESITETYLAEKDDIELQ